MESGIIQGDDLQSLKSKFESVQRKAIVFYSIRKAGGGKLGNAISAYVGSDATFHVNNKDDIEALKQAIADGKFDGNGTYFILGNKAIDISDELAAVIPVFAITILRDPVELMDAQLVSSGETATEFMKNYRPNKMLRTLKFKNGRDALRSHADRLSYTVTMDKIGAAMNILNWVLSLPQAAPAPKPASAPAAKPPAPAREEIDPSLLPDFIEANTGDFMFYEFMKMRQAQLARELEGLTA